MNHSKAGVCDGHAGHPLITPSSAVGDDLPALLGGEERSCHFQRLGGQMNLDAGASVYQRGELVPA